MPTSRKVSSLPQLQVDGLVAAHNEMCASLAREGKAVHYKEYSSSDLVATADASDLATSKTLALALVIAVKAHAISTTPHSAADDSSAATLAAAAASYPAEPADLTEVQNIANELKTDINAHIANATPHRGLHGAIVAATGVLTAHQITTTAASDQSTSNALLNAIKAFLNIHIKSTLQSVEVQVAN